ncbi:hypothetical protein C8J57DRAFT_511317 [Mycena rebaudengoi]|nr:hypothetical protein C8J57DRAFT_511317 [Mycena rebaudengoi]
MVLLTAVALAILTATSKAGTTLWTGNFDAYTSSADFDKWSWANQTGQYQWYIHGNLSTSHYLDVSPSYKNPADTEQRGLKLTIDTTAMWNSQFERSELIPQTTANLGTGNLFYHFSVSRSATNPPDPTLEHQVVFFESHFTELKYGIGPVGTNLNWMVSGVSKWSTPFVAGTWFNFAYDINFSAGTVGLWASTGSSPLTKVVQNIAASTSTNSADWHLGVLRLVNGGGPEDWFFSGVYIENGPITTSVGTGGGGGGSTTSTPTSSTTTKSSSTTSSTTTAAGPVQTHFGQCGGTGYTGPTNCTPFTCTPISPPFYYQCL